MKTLIPMMRVSKIPHSFVSWFYDEAFKRLIKNVGIVFSGDVMVTLFKVGAMAFMVRALGAKQFGILVLIQAYVDIVRTVVCFNSSSATIKFGSEALEANEKENLKGFIRLGFTIDLLAAVVTTLLALTLAYWVGSWAEWPENTVEMTMVYCIATLFQIRGTPGGIFRLFGRFRLSAVRGTVASGFRFILVFVCWYMQGSLWDFIFILVFAEIIGDLILIISACLVLVKEGVTEWWRAEMRDWRRFTIFTFWTNITLTLDMPVNHFDKVLVAMVTSVEGVALYKIFQRTAQVLTKVAKSFRYTILPQFSCLIAAGKGYSAVRIAIKSTIVLAVAASPIALVISLLAPYWIPIVFGQEYAKEFLALSILLLLKCISMACSSIHPLFVAMGLVAYNVPILLLSNMLYLLSAWYLGANYGLQGIIIGYGIQFSSVVLFKILIILNKFEGINTEKRYQVA